MDWDFQPSLEEFFVILGSFANQIGNIVSSLTFNPLLRNSL